jgi:hypothetical protein
MARVGTRVKVEDLPPVLTVEEAADVLRIGRASAYLLARRFEATGGREGLPVVRFGRSLRVPLTALLRILESVQPRDDHMAAWTGADSGVSPRAANATNQDS